MVGHRVSPTNRTRAAQARALKLLPATGRVEEFVDNVGASRGRSIKLLPFDLGHAALTGMWVATAEGDFVVFASAASASEQTAIICHELSHILLEHEPVDEAARVSGMAALVAPDIAPEVARRILSRHSYAENAEAEAEAFGTLLMRQLARRAARYSVANDPISDRLR